MSKLFYDTETCGLHGPIVLIQYAIDDSEVYLWNPWKNTINDTLELIEEFMTYENIGFNLAFDHFHLCQMYTTLRLLDDPRKILESCKDEYALKEEQGRFGPCLKPLSAHDVMLHARKTEYQTTMDRSSIRIRRIPTPLAWMLADELDKRIPLKDIYFARRKDVKQRWQVYDINNELGEMNTDFKDVVLNFCPSNALKALAQDALGVEDDNILLFGDISIHKNWYPDELGYAPFCTAIGEPGKWNHAWPAVIQQHIDHWEYHQLARKYAKDDVIYTRGLYEHFGSPECGDDDSILACMVAAVRWRGYAIDIPAIKQLKEKSVAALSKIQFNYNSAAKVKQYIGEVMDKMELITIKDSTKAAILEDISGWNISETCDCCGLEDDCTICGGDGLIETTDPHPAARRARLVLDARHADKEIELYDKLIKAGRFHASFKVTGTLSNRMSGADGLNAQGIKRDGGVRECFPLADRGMQLDGGDFAGFEVNLADAVYGDPVLHEDLLSGKKIHALFGQYLFPHMSYTEIVKSKIADDPWQNYYSRSKQGVFALIYGGEGFTLSNRVGVPEQVANDAYDKFVAKYPTFGREREKYFDAFRTMKQPKGIGTAVEWHDPVEFAESMFGFRRYYTLENQICKVLYDLGESPPKEWEDVKVKVIRRDKEQTACGATRSALFGAAFAIQGSNMRSAGNHIIQSSGATITKALQCEIWTIQPTGIAAWRVQPMNIHDEIMSPVLPQYSDQLTKIKDDFIIKYREMVPLLEIEWDANLTSWAEK